MKQNNRGSAYIIVVLASVPIFLVIFIAFTVSLNSRSISMLRAQTYGLYELASAANIIAMSLFEGAYIYNRNSVHAETIIYFAEYIYHAEYGIIFPKQYINRFRDEITPLIRNRLMEYFTDSDGLLTRQFEVSISYGSMDVFTGSTEIKFCINRVYFTTGIINANRRVEVRGIIRWPCEIERKVYFVYEKQLNFLDYFTPWVVELVRK